MAAQTILWCGRKGNARVFCMVQRGCAGVDLQIVEGELVSRRERYPDRSTAYERSQGVRAEFAAQGYEIDPGQ
jgi:hypothetical protein